MAESANCNLPCGYEEEFVSPVEEDLQCLICQLPLREPVLTRCGHRFCQACLDKHMERQENQQQERTCPVDREELDRNKDIFPDKATERKILSFIIKCSSDGCEWTGELRGKEVHLSSCCFKLVPCTNENCDVTIQRKDLEEHVTSTCQWKIEVCEYCSESHPSCRIQDHVKECQKKPVECPNSCGKSVIREEIESHIDNDCPLTKVSCPYSQMGCNTEIQRKEVDTHLQSTMRLHLDLACSNFQETTVRLEEKVKALQLKQEELEQEKMNLKSQVQELTAENSALSAKVSAQGKEVSELRNESSKFVWKISGFSKILQDAKDGIEDEIQSKSFFTGRTGYKLSVCIEPDGDQTQRNRYVSVHLYHMIGNYDAMLPWPFHYKVTFTLIYQQDDPCKRQNVVQSFLRCLNEKPPWDDVMMHCTDRFVSHKILYTRRYVVDDTLFLQVEIGPP